jgi:hypothetical protein
MRLRLIANTRRRLITKATKDTKSTKVFVIFVIFVIFVMRPWAVLSLEQPRTRYA